MTFLQATLKRSGISARRLLQVTLGLVALWAPLHAQGATRALLVGVSKYQNLPEYLQLEGPQNDVKLFRDFLVSSHYLEKGNIQVLADGVDGANGLPTRKAILGAFDGLAASAKPGDYIFILMAGHGSQQPATPQTVASEPDGMNEIFLPIDVAHWDPETGTVQNAIIDDEFGQALEKIRAAGASIWIVFDSCHAATIARGFPEPGERIRTVSPDLLGIPLKAFKSAEAAAAKMFKTAAENQAPVDKASRLNMAQNAGGGGSVVAFYAAQTYESERELTLPRDGSPDARPQGLFAYTLVSTLSRYPKASYRQLLQAVLENYANQNSSSPTPSLEGAAADTVPFLGAGSKVQQWQLVNTGNGLTLQAGQLQGVTPGSILALVPNAASADSDVVGYVKVKSAQASSASIEPTAYHNHPAPSADKLKRVSYARPVELTMDFKFSVSPPVKLASASAGEPCSEGPSKEVLDAIAALKTDSAKLAPRVNWVDPNQSADIHLCMGKGRLFFLDRDGSTASDISMLSRPSIPIDWHGTEATPPAQFGAQAIASALTQIGKVKNLYQVLGGIQHGSDGGQVAVQIEVQRGGKGTPLALSQDSRPKLNDGDVVSVTLTNNGSMAMDCTLLYIDSDYGISTLFPRPGETNRVTSHATHIVKDIVINIGLPKDERTYGPERLLLLAVRASPAADSSDFSALSQQALPVAMSERGGPHLTLVDVLSDAGFGSTQTRGVTIGGPGMDDLQAESLNWVVAP